MVFYGNENLKNHYVKMGTRASAGVLVSRFVAQQTVTQPEVFQFSFVSSYAWGTVNFFQLVNCLFTHPVICSLLWLRNDDFGG